MSAQRTPGPWNVRPAWTQGRHGGPVRCGWHLMNGADWAQTFALKRDASAEASRLNAVPGMAYVEQCMSDATTTTASIALSAEGLAKIEEVARAQRVSPRLLIESLMHFAISCYERPGSWEAQAFTLSNYVGEDGFADRWFNSDEPQPGASRDAAIGLFIRAGELDDAIDRAFDDECGDPQALHADLECVERRLEHIAATDPTGYESADQFVWARRHGPIPPPEFWAARARAAIAVASGAGAC